MINRIFQIRGKRINYKLENFSDLSEQKAIDVALGCAFNMAQLILHNLKNSDAKTAQSMQKIYGESAGAQTLSEAFKKIIEHIEHKFFVRREKIFAGENAEGIPEVFTSADRDTQKIIIYDAYFKTMPGDESWLNDRPSVLIHEMAHLNGFEGDAELGDINSAEALRNFALLACGLVDENLLFEKIRAAEQDDDLQGAGGELPYRPDQPRAPKGQPNGGQWIEDNSSPNGGESQNNSAQKNPPAKNTDSEKSAAEKSNIKENEKNNGRVDDNLRKKLLDEGNPPNGALDKNIRFGLIGKDRNATDKTGDLKDCCVNNSKGAWVGFNYIQSGLEPNTDYSFKFDTTINKENAPMDSDEKGDILSEVNGKFIYDTRSNEKGEVTIERAGILNDEKNESNPTPENYNKINIDLEISYAEGRPNDVYGKDNITTSAYPGGDDREYGQSHAGAREKGSFRTREDSQGGVLKDPKPNPKEKTVFKGSISINRNERD